MKNIKTCNFWFPRKEVSPLGYIEKQDYFGNEYMRRLVQIIQSLEVHEFGWQKRTTFDSSFKSLREVVSAIEGISTGLLLSCYTTAAYVTLNNPDYGRYFFGFCVLRYTGRPGQYAFLHAWAVDQKGHFTDPQTDVQVALAAFKKGDDLRKLQEEMRGAAYYYGIEIPQNILSEICETEQGSFKPRMPKNFWGELMRSHLTSDEATERLIERLKGF